MKLNSFLGKKIGGKSGIATVSVALSLWVMLTAIAVSEGFKREIGRKAVAFSGEIMLAVPGQEITTYEYPLNENLSFLPDIKSLDDVKSVYGVACAVGMVKTDEAISGALFKGVCSDYDLSFFSSYLRDGRLPDFTSETPSDEILISRRLASQMGYSAGERITAYFVGDGDVKARKFTVSGIYDIQLEDVDERLIVCDRRHSQMLNGWTSEEVSCIEIYLGGDGSGLSGARRERVMSRIDDIMISAYSDDDSNVTVQSVDQVYSALFDWLNLLNMNVLIILVLMTVVAGFNMISGLLIILFRNISAIGLLKSLGMRTSQVCRVFLWKAGGIIVRGMAAGDIAALVVLMSQKYFKVMKLDPANYFVDHVPVHLTPLMFISVNVIAFIIMMLIMMIPCRFISGVSPDRTIKAA